MLSGVMLPAPLPEFLCIAASSRGSSLPRASASLLLERLKG